MIGRRLFVGAVFGFVASMALPREGSRREPDRRPVQRIVVTKPGTVLDGLDIHGTITIAATGVLIRNCRIVSPGPDEPCIFVRSGMVCIAGESTHMELGEG